MAQNNELDRAFSEFEKEFDTSREMRRGAIEMLQKEVAKVQISEYDKPMMIQAKMMIVKTFDDMLKSNEDITLKKLKMKLARKDSETNGVVGTAIVNLLKEVRADREKGTEAKVSDLAQAAEDITKRGEERGIKISDGELELCGDSPNSDAPRPEDEKEDDE